MTVNISSTLPPVMATCSFLSGFTGDAFCRVDFTGPDGVTYMSPITSTASTSPLGHDAGGAKADDQVEMEENIAYEKANSFKLTKM